MLQSGIHVDSPSGRSSIPELPAQAEPFGLRDRGLVLLVTLIFASVSYYVHLSTDSMFSWTATAWEGAISFHQVNYPFSARVFTTSLVRFVHWSTGFSLGLAFQLVQLALYLFLGQTFACYLMALGFRRPYVLGGLVLLFSAYPILCAFFQPVYTWDDFWLYAFVPLAFSLVLRNRPLIGSICFTVALVARETTILLYLPMALLMVNFPPQRKWKLWVGLALPPVTYVVYSLLTSSRSDPSLLHMFSLNFSNSSWAASSVFSLLISFGFLWLTVVLAVVILGKDLLHSRRYNFLIVGALLVLPAVVITTVVFARMRETRLFFPPFVFVIPLTLLWVQVYGRRVAALLRFGWGIPAILVVAGAVYAGQALELLLFPTLDIRPWQAFVQWFLGAHFGVAAVLLLVALGFLFAGAVRRQRFL